MFLFIIHAHRLLASLISVLAQGVADFTPEWVLVVTWLNLAGDVGCREVSRIEKLYGFYWDADKALWCTLQAEKLPVSPCGFKYI